MAASKLTVEQLESLLRNQTLPNDEIWLSSADYGDAQLWVVRDGDIVYTLMEG